MSLKKTNYEIIIQAGGRGSRLRHYTWNKPKCLVSYYGKPIIYYTFDQFKDANFHIIGDYQIDKIKKYFLISPPKVNYKIYRTKKNGTCAGIKDVLKNISNNKKIILIWADLIIEKFPKNLENKTIFTTSSFTCRWSFKNNKLEESPSSKKGIPGIFYFKNKLDLKNVPVSGEFVKWLSKSSKRHKTLEINPLKELGDFDTIADSYDQIGFGRYFNEIKISKNTVTKKAKVKEFEKLITREQFWYDEIKKLKFKNIPKIYSKKPYKMENIKGNHIFEIKNLEKKKIFKIIENALNSLLQLHKSNKILSNKKDLKEVYINKTLSRLNSISKIIPNFKTELSFTINGKKCRNYLHPKYKDIFKYIEKSLYVNSFCPIHGDPTFSNFKINNNLKPYFFDPRGYFANEKSIYGDANYDYAKLYYSAIGNYDFFNRRKFKLYINNNTIEILLDNILEHNVSNVFKSFSKNNFYKIKILHGLIWLALSGYVKDDIDSILASFYNGLYWLNEALD